MINATTQKKNWKEKKRREKIRIVNEIYVMGRMRMYVQIYYNI